MVKKSLFTYLLAVSILFAFHVTIAEASIPLGNLGTTNHMYFLDEEIWDSATDPESLYSNKNRFIYCIVDEEYAINGEVMDHEVTYNYRFEETSNGWVYTVTMLTDGKRKEYNTPRYVSSNKLANDVLYVLLTR